VMMVYQPKKYTLIFDAKSIKCFIIFPLFFCSYKIVSLVEPTCVH
jgi:hypothetical protein